MRCLSAPCLQRLITSRLLVFSGLRALPPFGTLCPVLLEDGITLDCGDGSHFSSSILVSLFLTLLCFVADNVDCFPVLWGQYVVYLSSEENRKLFAADVLKASPVVPPCSH